MMPAPSRRIVPVRTTRIPVAVAQGVFKYVEETRILYNV